ncbi:MAG TPA: 8-amino-7-oxononanoate synthase [Nitrospinota bacterium]|nr:8-amino-7-oxononanoate synthase [Nitrospinota bacterium]
MKEIREELDILKEKGLYRWLRSIKGEQGPFINLGGKRVLNLSSNNYLGLANHPKVKEALISATEKYGASAGASRLISGNIEIYDELEERISKFKGVERALVFSSGYMANIGIISSFVGKDDVIFSDKLNHASIIDGCMLSRAMFKRFPHKDMEKLEALLKDSSKYRRRLIITEGVFSMDGDIAPLPEIIQLAKKYSAYVMLDDAHATGVLGKNGKGTMEYFGLDEGIDILMGTFGKALGVFGAYVGGKKEIREYFINRARSFIFTTGLPPGVVGAIIKAIEIAEKEGGLREWLWRNAVFFRTWLKELGFDTMESNTQIIPILIGDTKKTMDMTEMLLKEGVFAQGIRPPTVPQGYARLRTTVMATHSIEDLEKALNIFKKAGRELNII